MGELHSGKISIGTTASLDELFDYQIKFARFAFDANGGGISPMWVGQDADGIIYPITVEWNGSEEKYAMIEEVKKLFTKLNVIRYVSMVEAWMVIADARNKEEAKEIINAGVANHPRKQEAIIITGEEKGRNLFGYLPINRGEEGKATLGEFVRHDGAGHYAGRMGPILTQPTVH